MHEGNWHEINTFLSRRPSIDKLVAEMDYFKKYVHLAIHT